MSTDVQGSDGQPGGALPTHLCPSAPGWRVVRVSWYRYAASLLLIGAWLVAGVPALAAQCTTEPAPPAPGSGIHAPFDGLLRAFVHDGVVDYGCFQAHEGQLDTYLKVLAHIDPAALSRDKQLALWINAYNAFTIKLILSRYPQIESIKEIPRRWDRQEWQVGGRRYSLDEIEHEVLRKRFGEPRIHCAIVCASKSCPDLAAEAYLAGRLDEQLDRAVHRFLADPRKGARVARESGLLGRKSDRLYLSAIFKWFREDFERSGELIDFVRPYLPTAAQAFVDAAGSDLSIAFMDYDWTLNGR